MRVAPLTVGLVVASSLAIAAQSAKPAATPPAKAAPARQAPKPTIPKTPDGRPDLQGTWEFAQLTPFERPSAFAGKDAVSKEEADLYAAERIESSNKDRRDGPATADVERAYNDFWWDFGTRVAKQTSLVIDPADG